MAEVTSTPEGGAEQVLNLNAGDGDSISFPEGFDLTSAEFQVQGDDLVVTAPDGTQVVVEDYYTQDNPPTLTSPDGAQLSGEMVVQLAEGPVGDSVSAGTDSASSALEGSIAANPSVITGTDGEPIGNVENLSGQVFAIRADGTRVELNVGDPVYQGDILESGADGSIGVLLADETTFSMGESGRMVLDEMIYDPATQEGSVSMTALQGVFTFVSGQVAKTDPDAMTLDTPVATIGIRGTQVGLDIADGQNLDVVLMEEADGFVGEVVVMNDAGVQVLNGANQTTGITGFQAPPTAVSVIDQERMVEQYDAPLRHLPIVHGNQNDFGLQRQDDGEFLDKEIEELEEAAPEDLANFETAAGQEEQEGAQPDILPVSGELEQLKILDPFTEVKANQGSEETTTEGGGEDEIIEEIIETQEEVVPPGKQAIVGAGGKTIFVPEEIEDATYNPDTGKIEGKVNGNLETDPDDTNSYDLEAGGEDNTVGTGSGSDHIRGGGGDDSLSGGAGDDTLDGGAGNDTLDGGEGDDTLIGGEGDDLVIGGEGNDVIVAGGNDGNDTYIGGDGEDEVDYGDAGDGINLVVNLTQGTGKSGGGQNPWLNVDTLEGIENITGTAGDDILIGNAGTNTIDGGAGNDTIDGRAGDDFLIGGEGDDYIVGGYGNDILVGGAGNNLLVGGHGTDEARFDGQFDGFDIGIDGDDFVVTNLETGEKTALRGIEQMVFSENGVDQSYRIVEFEGVEDQPLDLDFLGQVPTGENAPALEDVTLSVKGFPEGTTLQVGSTIIEPDADGVYSVDGVDLANVVVNLPEDYGEDMALDVSVSTAEGEIARSYMSVDMQAIADMPHIEAIDVAGGEDLPMGLSLDATLGDLDGSETLSITLSGVPFGGFVEVTHEDGTTTLEEGQGLATLRSEYTGVDENGNPTIIKLEFAQDPHNGTFTIDSGALGLSPSEMSEVMANLVMTPALHHDEDFTVTVEATVTDSDGDTETSFTTAGGETVDHLTFDVEVYDRADAPTMDVTHAVGDEDTRIALTFDADTVDESEVLSMSVSGIPEGATFYVQYEIGGKTVEVPMPVLEYDENGLGIVQIPSALVGSTFLVQPPADSNVDFDLKITATSFEPDATETWIGGPSDNDGSDIQSIVVSGLPEGASLSAGTDNGDGTWTLSLADLGGLQVSPVNNLEPFTLDVSVTALRDDTPNIEGDTFEGSFELDVSLADVLDGAASPDILGALGSQLRYQTATTEQDLHVQVDSVADEIPLTADAAQGDEDTAIPLDIYTELQDTDGSESISITIEGVPEGASLNHGIYDAETGNWTLTTADLAGLTITPPANSDADFTLNVTATVTDVGEEGDIDVWQTEAPVELHVTVDPVADTPVLITQPATGYEDEPIPLDIEAALTDTDGSEVLSITISGVPEGAVLSAGTDLGDGSWVLTPEQLDGLTVTPPADSNVNFDLTVTATATETGAPGEIAELTSTLGVNVLGVADEITLDAAGEDGNAGFEIPLNIATGITDTDGSETVSISISGMPEGTVFSAGTDNGDGTWSFTNADLDGLTVTPPVGYDGEMTLDVVATTTDIEPTGEPEHVDTNSVSGTITFEVDGESETPTLDLSDTGGLEDTAIPLDIQAALTDTDGSEFLSITVSGVPDGASLSAGEDLGNGSWLLTPDQLEGLTVTPKADSNVDFELTVTATAHTVPGPGEYEPGSEEIVDTADTVGTIFVDVVGVADTPDLATENATGDEDTAIPLNIDASLIDVDGSETLSIVITGVPEGASLNTGIHDTETGTWTLTPEQLEGLTITPPLGSTEDFDLMVTATTTENDAGTEFDVNGNDVGIDSVALPLHVNVLDVADQPTLVLRDNVGYEDYDIPVPLHAALTDDSEVLSVSITGVPEGASLSAGVYDPETDSWAVDPADLAGLTVSPPPDSNEDFTLTVTATSTSEDGDIATTTGDVFIEVIGVADRPDLETQDATGEEGVPIPLDIEAGLTDIDGSETLTIEISNVPEGAVIAVGGQALTPDDNGVYTLNADQFGDVSVTAPPDTDGDFTLHVVAKATEDDGDVAINAGVINVTVDVDAAEPPALVLNDVQGVEDNAIALDITAAVTSEDDQLSITISGMPEGAVLSAGTDNGDGSWTLTPQQLTGLTVTPPADSNVNFDLTVTATATDGSDTATTVGTLTVDVLGDADTPTLQTTDASGSEGEAIPLDISAAVTDVDGSETLSITIAGVPEGASLSAGTDNGNGTWTLSAGDLDNLSITTADGFDDDFTLTVSATAIDVEPSGEAPHTDTATVIGTIDVDMSANAEPPVLVLEDAAGNEDTAIPLDIVASVGEMDDELVSITISDIPEGVVLSAGTVNQDGSVTLTPEQLDGLTVTPPLHSDVDFNLTVTATSQDGDDTATTTGSIAVAVAAVADTPDLAAGDGDGDVGQTIPLDISSALVDTDGSETLSITIADMPAGASLSAGTDNGDGTWALSAGDLDNLTITLPAGASDDFDLTVTSTATEADGGDQAARTVTSAINVDPNAIDDADTVDSGETATGNVLDNDTGSIAGANSVTDVTFGNVTKSFANPDDVMSDDGGDYLLLEGEHGTLKMYGDGTYEYAADDNGTGGTETAGLEGTGSAADVEAAWSGIETFAFDFGTSYLNGNGQLDPSLADDSVTFNSNGIGVAGTQNGMPVGNQINHDDLTGESEALGINLGTEAGSAQVKLSNLYMNEDGGERGMWQAFDADGNLVGEGAIDGNSVDYDGSNNVGTLNIDTGGAAFQYIVFTATDTGNDTNPLDSSDFFVRSVEFDTAGPNEGEDVFTYTMSDADGDTAVANLTINVENGDVYAEPPVLVVDDVTGYEDSAIPLDIAAALTDTDGSETLSITISDIPQGAVLSAGTINQDGSVTLTPEQLEGLTITPAHDSNVDFDLTVAATSVESSTGDTTTTTASMTVDVVGVADEPPLTVELGDGTPVSGGDMPDFPPFDHAISNIVLYVEGENGEITKVKIDDFSGGQDAVHDVNDLDLTGFVADHYPGGELLAMTVKAGNNHPDGYGPGEGELLIVQSGVSEGDLPVSAHADDSFDYTNVAGELADGAVGGIAGTEYPLDITTNLVDTDGSETLSISVGGLPEGVTLSAGTQNDDGSWTVPQEDLDGLTMFVPADQEAGFDIAVTSTTTENDGDTASVTASVSVNAGDVTAEAPELEVQAAQGNEDTAIALDIAAALTDTDGSETLSVTISDIPEGAVLSAGTVNDDGSVTLTPEELAGLTITPPANSNQDFNLTVSAKSVESASGDTSTVSASLAVDVIGVADAPGAGAEDVTGAEDNWIALDLERQMSEDTDGSETLSITISGVPQGAELSAGTDNGNGVWTISAADLGNVSILPPQDFSGEMDMSLSVTTTEDDGDTATVTQDFTVTVDAVADTPDLDLNNVQGIEDNVVPLDISAALTDVDGSETLSITISDIPEGVTLSAGTVNDDGSVTLTSEQLEGLSLTTPLHSNVDFDLTVTATSMDGTDTAVSAGTVHVDMVGVADAPPLDVSLGEGTYVPGEEGLGSITIENVGNASAGYHNSYGYFTMDAEGNPVAGKVIWDDVKDTVGDSFTIEGVDPETIGFFLIPNGDNVNPALESGLDVTFEQNENGQWVPIGPNGEELSGQGAPALFSEPGLNTNDFDYMVDNQIVGNQNWEDLVNGGDQDFNDANFQATVEPGDSSPGATVFPLDIATNLVDADGSETLSITVSDLPEGAVLSAGTVNDDGTVTLTSAELEGLTLTVPEGAGAFSLTVTSTTPDTDRDTASVSAPVGVETDVVAEAPDLEVQPAQGDEDTAIALDIAAALTDTDGSETLSVTISGIPDGAELSAGSVNDDGSVTLTPEELEGLTITPPANSNVDFDLTVTATSVESASGDTATTSATLAVDVIGVADTPGADADDVSGAEDQWIALDLESQMSADTDGSETLSITISGLPAGADLSAGTDNGDGVWSVPVADLADLSIRPPQDFAGEIDLSMSVTTTENDGDTNTVTENFTVTVEAVADNPDLDLNNVQGVEDNLVPLDISAALTDTDGSETLSITISDIPAGVTLTAGTVNDDGSVTLTSAELDGLALRTPLHSNEDFALTVTATSTDGTDTAVTSGTVQVDMVGVADTPPLEIALGEGTVVGSEPEDVTINMDNVLDTSSGFSVAARSIGNNGNLGDASADNISFHNSYPQGFGVAGSSSGDQTEIGYDDGTSEELIVTFDQDVASADVSFAWLHGGEDAVYELYQDGVKVGEGVVDGGSDGIDPAITLTAEGGVSFDQIVFSAPGNGDDYLINSIDFVAAGAGTAVEYPLDISTQLVDADGSETLSITVNDLPEGAVLSAGTVNQDGSVTLTAADLTGLTLRVPAGTDSFDLSVTSTTTENDGDSASVTATLTVAASDMTAEAPELSAEDAAGLEDAAIALNIAAALTDTDGSETLSVTISDIPTGAELSAGTLNDDGSVTLTADQLEGLTITPATNSNVDFDLTITATSVESASGDMATTTTTLGVDVTGVADQPQLTAELGEPTEVSGGVTPVSYWRLDEDYGGQTLQDAVGDNDGTPVNTLKTNNETGVFDGAAEFSGGGKSYNEEYIEVAHTDELKPANGALTLWFNADDCGGRNCLASSDSGGNDDGGHFGLFIENGQLRLRMQGDNAEGETNLYGGSVGTNSWNQVTVTWGDEGAKIFLNGQEVASDPNWTRGLEGNENPWTFGANQWQSSDDVANNMQDYFDGHMDDIAIYNQQLSADQVADLYSNGVSSMMEGGDASGLVYPLDISADLMDTDGSETLSITVDGLPEGAVLSAGTVNPDGSVTLTAAQLDGLTVTVPDGTDAFDLTVAATATENDGDVSTISTTVGVASSDVTADGVDLSAADAAGLEDAWIALDISAALTDTDGSETLSVTISGIPNGAELSTGTLNDDGSVTLTADQLDGLSIKPPANSNVDFALTVSATSTESNSGDTATTTTSVDVDVTGVADAASLEAAIGTPTLVEVPGETPEPTQVFLSTFGSQSGFVSQVDGWSTSSDAIEVWADGEQGHNGEGSFVELNDDKIDNYDDATNIMRSFPTEEGATYTLTFEYSPRPGYDSDVNAFEFRVDGETLGSLSPDGSGNSDNVWQSHTVTFVGTGEPMSLEFLTTGEAENYGRGIRLDNIGLQETLPATDAETLVEYPLDITSALTDQDGSETLAITVGNLPDGAVLSAGTDNGNGTYTLSTADLAELKVTVPMDTPAFDIAVSATTTENDGDTTTVSTSVAVGAFDGVAETPVVDLAIGDGVVVDEDDLDDYGFENGSGTAVAGSVYAVALSAGLVDTDGSESLAITLGGLPEGVELSAGTDNGDGTWSLQSGELSGLNLYVPADVSTDFTIEVTAVSTEQSTGDTATITDSAAVDIVDVPTEPVEGQNIYGGHGADTLIGGEGDDNIYAGNNDDYVEGRGGDDNIYGSHGSDTLDGGAGDDSLYGGNNDDVLSGGDGADYLSGSHGRDTLDGGAGDDVISAGNDDDVIIGGAGNDTLTGGWGDDQFIFDAESGQDIITDIMDQDKLVFEGQEFHMDDLILSENEEGNVVVSFDGVENSEVTLDGVRMEDLQDNNGDAGYSVTEDGGKVTITIDTQ